MKSRTISKVLFVVNITFGILNIARGIITGNLSMVAIGILGLAVAYILARQL